MKRPYTCAHCHNPIGGKMSTLEVGDDYRLVVRWHFADGEACCADADEIYQRIADSANYPEDAAEGQRILAEAFVALHQRTAAAGGAELLRRVIDVRADYTLNKGLTLRGKGLAWGRPSRTVR